MPRNALMPVFATPRTIPPVVSTSKNSGPFMRAAGVCAFAAAPPAAPAAPAATIPASPALITLRRERSTAMSASLTGLLCHNRRMLRRAFLSTLSSAGPLLAVQAPPPATAPAPGRGPARHPQDDWLDEAPEKHRVVFDTWLADKFAGAFGFAGNWIKVNKEQYGL